MSGLQVLSIWSFELWNKEEEPLFLQVVKTPMFLSTTSRWWTSANDASLELQIAATSTASLEIVGAFTNISSIAHTQWSFYPIQILSLHKPELRPAGPAGVIFISLVPFIIPGSSEENLPTSKSKFCQFFCRRSDWASAAFSLVTNALHRQSGKPFLLKCSQHALRNIVVLSCVLYPSFELE